MTEIKMPHPAHFIGARECLFFRSSYINGFIISTVGEYFPESTGVMEVIGHKRFYETMVFKAKESDACPDCPYSVADWDNLDFDEYNLKQDAIDGHKRMVDKYREIK